MSHNFVIYFHFLLHHNIDVFLSFIIFFQHRRILGHLSAVYCVLFDRSGECIITVSLIGKTEKSILEWAKYTCMRTHNTCRTFKMRVLPNMMSDSLYLASSKFCTCMCVLLTVLSLAEIRDSRQSTHRMVFCNNNSFILFYYVLFIVYSNKLFRINYLYCKYILQTLGG